MNLHWQNRHVPPTGTLSLSTYLATHPTTTLARRLRWLESIALQLTQAHLTGHLLVGLDPLTVYTHTEAPESLIVKPVSGVRGHFEGGSGRVVGPYRADFFPDVAELVPPFYHPEYLNRNRDRLDHNDRAAVGALMVFILVQPQAVNITHNYWDEYDLRFPLPRRIPIQLREAIDAYLSPHIDSARVARRCLDKALVYLEGDPAWIEALQEISYWLPEACGSICSLSLKDVRVELMPPTQNRPLAESVVLETDPTGAEQAQWSRVVK